MKKENCIDYKAESKWRKEEHQRRFKKIKQNILFLFLIYVKKNSLK